MADNTPIVDGSSVLEEISTDELATQNGVDVSAANPRIKIQRVKPAFGSDGDATDVDATHGLPVSQVGGLPAGTNVIGHVIVDSGSIAANTGLTTADLDTGGGVDTRAVVGIARAESGGAVLVGTANPLPINDAGGSLTVDGTISVSSGPAAARTTDSISAALATDAIMNGTTVLTPQFAPITASASGVTTIVAAVASKKIRILGAVIVCTTAVTVKFQSHTTTATATGAFPFGANGGAAIPFSPVGWFETVAGEALDINLGSAVAVGGQLIYTTL